MPTPLLIILLIFFLSLIIIGLFMGRLEQANRQLKKEHPTLLAEMGKPDSYWGTYLPYIWAWRKKQRLELETLAREAWEAKPSHIINQDNPVPYLAVQPAREARACWFASYIFGALGAFLLLGNVPSQYSPEGWGAASILIAIVTLFCGVQVEKKAVGLTKPQILMSINGMEFHPKMQDGSIAHIKLQIQLIKSEWDQQVSDRLHADLSAFFAGSFSTIAVLPDFAALEKALVPPLETVYSELSLNLLRHRVLSLEQEKKKAASASPNEPGILF